MNVEEARAAVAETLGEGWRLARVEAQLEPGGHVGAPTRQTVTVELDYQGPGRPEGDVYATGPHCAFLGTAGDVEGAIAVAVGKAERHPWALPTGNVRREATADA